MAGLMNITVSVWDIRPGDKQYQHRFRGWWRPESTGTATPSISVGYDTSETDATGNSSTFAYFVGLNWQDIINADDRIGVAFGQPQKLRVTQLTLLV